MTHYGSYCQKSCQPFLVFHCYIFPPGVAGASGHGHRRDEEGGFGSRGDARGSGQRMPRHSLNDTRQEKDRGQHSKASSICRTITKTKASCIMGWLHVPKNDSLKSPNAAQYWYPGS